MTLFVNGDSHSAGTDAGGINSSYGQHIAIHLQLKLQSYATPGASNFKILRTTKEYLNKNKPSLVIIGWATWDREEWISSTGELWQISPGKKIIPDEFRESYKQWVVRATDPSFIKLREIYFHNEIYNLHIDLKNQNIPHLFFNTYLYFQSIKDYNLPKYDWGDNFLNPYDNDSTFYYWLENQGFRTIKNYHYGKDAHEAWANKLIKDLTNIR